MSGDRPTRAAPRTAADIRAITEARLTLGPRRGAVTTQTALTFALDHARARAAVESALDLPRIADALSRAGLTTHEVTSAAGTRDQFIRRPDLGRRLADADATALAGLERCDVALVLGDGLSATAANFYGADLLIRLSNRLSERGLRLSPIILASQCRVALGDPIACALGADTVVVALGERPGLSAADSLGLYMTQAPRDGMPDSGRNCLSNIREAGMGLDQAAEQAMALILAMRAQGESGVALSQMLAQGALPG